MKINASIWIGSLILLIAALACAGGNRAGDDPSTTTHKLTFDGIDRSYILHVPASYNGSQELPLVISLHGGTGNAENAMRVTNFNPLADEKGFIVVYPDGTGRLEDKILTWNGGTCCGYAMTHQADDVGFMRALIKEIESSYKIDPERIYANGLSNGGIMSYRLACEASDVFAAIGSVSGTLNDQKCAPHEPVSVIHFHGTDDQHIQYDGGYGPDSLAQVAFTSVKDSIAFWTAYDGCASAPQTEKFADIQHDTYSACKNNTVVELYTIIGGKHAWPGNGGAAWLSGDQPTNSISATSLLWDFFAAHPKP